MTVDIYTGFFGFTERPFTLLPDPDFMFWSPVHLRAFSVLEYGIASRAPLTVVTGEIGSGKTTLIQHLLTSMEGNARIALISNACGDKGDLLRWVLYALEVEIDSSDDYILLFNKFQQFVVQEYARGGHVIIVVDEAQNLSIDALEELRMFTNINSNKDELLQLILVGQPELRDIIRDPALTQFAQRVSAAYHLKTFDLETTRNYIWHRLRHVGGTGDEISQQAIQAIFRESRGVPRNINKMCDMALVYAAGDGKHQADTDVVQEMMRDDLFVQSKPRGLYILENPINVNFNKVAE